jgi:hypothetical protein
MGFDGATGRIALKVNSCYCWNTAVGTSLAQPSLEGLFWELNTDSGGSYSVRSEQYDHGTLNIPARTGYLWPLTDRKEVHTVSNDSHVVASFVVPAGANGNGNVTVRIQVLWNCSAVTTQKNVAQTPPLLPPDLDDLTIQSNNDGANTGDAAQISGSRADSLLDA